MGVWIYDISKASAGQTLLIGCADVYHAPDVGVYKHSQSVIYFDQLSTGYDVAAGNFLLAKNL